MNKIVYMLQVSTCMGGFYLFYYFLLNKLTFFTTNRWYLMATLALSFIIPLLTITVRTEYVPNIERTFYVNQLQNLPAQQQIIDVQKAVVQSSINWLAILKVTYLVPVAILFIRLGIGLLVLFAKIKSKNSISIGYIHIVRGNKKLNNGSFLNYIFLNDDELDEDAIQQIIQHEMLHIKLLHSVDRIILEIIKVILWFNPFIYLYARAVEENHEFEVDHEIGRLADKNKYADMLLHLSVSSRGILYHSFSKVPLEKRITMLFNQPTKNMRKIIYVLVLPIGVISCLAFANLKTKKKGIDISKSNSLLRSRVDTNTNSEKPIRSPEQLAAYDRNLKTEKKRIDISKSDSLLRSTVDAKQPAVYGRTDAEFASQDSSFQFYSRIHHRIHRDGKIFDKVTFRLAHGSASANLGTEDKLGIFIDGTFYNEDDIKKLSAEKTASLFIDNSRNAFKREKIPNGNYAVPFCFSKTNRVASDTTEIKQK